MEFLLPRSKATVCIYDYIPQSVEEAYQEALTTNMRLGSEALRPITEDDILRELGGVSVTAYRDGKQEERTAMEKEVRKKLTAKSMRNEFSMADSNRANRVRACGMITKILQGEGDMAQTIIGAKSIEDFISGLPRSDYTFLQKKIDEVEAKEEEQEKKTHEANKENS